MIYSTAINRQKLKFLSCNTYEIIKNYCVLNNFSFNYLLNYNYNVQNLDFSKMVFLFKKKNSQKIYINNKYFEISQ